MSGLGDTRMILRPSGQVLEDALNFISSEGGGGLSGTSSLQAQYNALVFGPDTSSPLETAVGAAGNDLVVRVGSVAERAGAGKFGDGIVLQGQIFENQLPSLRGTLSCAAVVDWDGFDDRAGTNNNYFLFWAGEYDFGNGNWGVGIRDMGGGLGAWFFFHGPQSTPTPALPVYYLSSPAAIATGRHKIYVVRDASIPFSITVNVDGVDVVTQVPTHSSNQYPTGPLCVGGRIASDLLVPNSSTNGTWNGAIYSQHAFDNIVVDPATLLAILDDIGDDEFIDGETYGYKFEGFTQGPIAKLYVVSGSSDGAGNFSIPLAGTIITAVSGVFLQAVGAANKADLLTSAYPTLTGRVINVTTGLPVISAAFFGFIAGT